MDFLFRAYVIYIATSFAMIAGRYFQIAFFLNLSPAMAVGVIPLSLGLIAFPIVEFFVGKILDAIAQNNQRRWQAQHQNQVQPQPQPVGNAVKDAFFIACRDGDLELLKSALKQGAEVNNKNERGETPLHMLCKLAPHRLRPEHFKIGKLLLKGGADPLAKDNNDRIPLHYACASGAHELFAIFEETPAIFNHSEKLNVTPEPEAVGLSPLMALLKGNKVPAARKEVALLRLLALGANPNFRLLIKDGGPHYREVYLAEFSTGNALHFVLEQYNEHLNNCLEVRRANTIDNNYVTNLFKICNTLIDHGADPSSRMRGYELYPDQKWKISSSVTSESLLQINERYRKKANRDPNYAVKFNQIMGVIQENEQYKLFLEKMERARALSEKDFPPSLEKITTDVGLTNVIQDALALQKRGKIEGAVAKLADAFLKAKPAANLKGLEIMANTVTPQDNGYAHLHQILANLNFISAGIKFDVNTRKSCLKHCLLGLQSQEKDSKDKTDSMILLKHLLENACKEWGLDAALGQVNKDKDEDVFEWVADKLLASAYQKAKARKTTFMPTIPAQTMHGCAKHQPT